MRMPHMQTQGAYFIDLNHACLLSFQPSHFGMPAASAADSTAGHAAEPAAAESGAGTALASAATNSSTLAAGAGQKAGPTVEFARRRQLRAIMAERPRQPARKGQIRWHARQRGTSQRQHHSQLGQQPEAGRTGTLTTGTLAFERVVVSFRGRLPSVCSRAVTADAVEPAVDLIDDRGCKRKLIENSFNCTCRTCRVAATSSWCAGTA